VEQKCLTGSLMISATWYRTLLEDSLVGLQSIIVWKLSATISCNAFIGLSIRANMIGGGRPLLRENLADTDPPLAKRWFSINFRS